jgi:hypothetical protein
MNDEDKELFDRLSRAPDSRVISLDIGDIPEDDAASYIKKVMEQHRNFNKDNLDN